MNKREVIEIRKQYKPEDCSITRICGCYVNGNRCNIPRRFRITSR